MEIFCCNIQLEDLNKIKLQAIQNTDKARSALYFIRLYFVLSVAIFSLLLSHIVTCNLAK